MEADKLPNLEPELWIDFCTTAYYLDYMEKILRRYQNYTLQEAERTGRFPKSLIKDALALCVEHGWKAQAGEFAMMLAKYG